VRGDPGMIPHLARRIGGSRDLFSKRRSPARSVNFVTCHDGFTLRDLVSYERKHNERNGEDNRDGADENFSANWGVEGETSNPRIRRQRIQVAKNVLTALFISRGTPMLLGGDELWRTQDGNNNVYCQDNELSWFNWDVDAEAEEIMRFIRAIIELRRQHPALRRPSFVDPFVVDGAGVGGPVGSDITWHGVKLGQADWSHHSRSLALHIHGKPPRAAPESADCDLYVILNSWEQPLTFELPPLDHSRRWRRLVDTAQPPPDDIVLSPDAPEIDKDVYRTAAYSVVVLMS
jgi:glycogen operon protein